MKRIAIFVWTLVVLSAPDATAQCNSEALSNQCIPKLASGFNF